jgi:hypothetical protein
VSRVSSKYSPTAKGQRRYVISTAESRLKEIHTHESDFFGIRIQYLLSKLRTYIGLARISEYPITKVQWLDWFEQEVWVLFDDLQKAIKSTEG